MKTVKRLFLALLLIGTLYFIIVGLFCAPQSSPFPGDYPDSQWVFEGETDTIELIVDSEDAERGFFYGSMTTDYGNGKIEFVFDTITDSVILVPVEENAVKGEIIDMSTMILRGSFDCTEEELIIRSSHYNDLFGETNRDPLSEEKSPTIELVFERVK